MTTVDVLLVTYDVEPFIAESIRSILEQTHLPTHLIIVDDGSADGTRSVIEASIADSPVPVTVLFREHSGIAATFAAGLAACTSDWVAIQHGDDVASPNRIEEQLGAAVSARKPVLVHSEYVVIDEESHRVDGLDSSLDLLPAEGTCLRDLLLLRRDVRSMTMFFDRRRFIAVGGYELGYASEDWQSILKLASIGPIAHVPMPLVERRIRRSSQSALDHSTVHRFELGQIGYPLIVDLCPDDLDPQRIAALHAGTVIRNALAHGNTAKAAAGLRLCWSTFPRGRIRLLRAAASGTVARAWHLVEPILPRGAPRYIRRARSRLNMGRVISRRSARAGHGTGASRP